MKILVVGSSNVDTTLYVNSLPKDGETIYSLSKKVTLGGKGLNQAVAIKRADGDVTFLTSLGDDINGQLVKNQIKEAGFAVFFEIKEGFNTGSAFINVSEKGENSIVIDGGSNALLSPNDLEKYALKFNEFDMLLLQNEICEESNKYLIEAFHSLKKLLR